MKLNNSVILISLLLCINSFCYADLAWYQQQQEDVVAASQNKYTPEMVENQRQQKLKANIAAARIYEITGIPTWRNYQFLNQSKTNEELVKNINVYLSTNYQRSLSAGQEA